MRRIYAPIALVAALSAFVAVNYAAVWVIPPYMYGGYLASTQTPDLNKTSAEIERLTMPIKHVTAAANSPCVYACPNRDLKGDRLTPEQLAIQWQGLKRDGTPIAEEAFHDEEERTSSTSAKN